MMNNRPTDIAPTLKCHQVLLSLKIFIVENVHYKQSNNTVTQSNRIRTKVGSSGNTLEGDVSDVIALDQLTSPFSPRKATRMSP